MANRIDKTTTLPELNNLSIDKAVFFLPAIDEMVTAFQSYLRVEDNIYLKQNTPKNLKIAFINEQRQGFVIRVEDCLERLKMFTKSPIYQEVKQAVDQTRQVKDPPSEAHYLEDTFQHLKALSGKLHEYRSSKRERIISLKADEKFYHVASDKLQSFINGSFIFIKQDSEPSEKPKTLLSTFVSKAKKFLSRIVGGGKSEVVVDKRGKILHFLKIWSNLFEDLLRKSKKEGVSSIHLESFKRSVIDKISGENGLIPSLSRTELNPSSYEKINQTVSDLQKYLNSVNKSEVILRDALEQAQKII